MPQKYVDITDSRPYINGRYRMQMVAAHVQPDGRRVMSKGALVVEMWVNPISRHVEPFFVLRSVNGRFPKTDATLTLVEDWRPYAKTASAEPVEDPVQDAEYYEADAPDAFDYDLSNGFVGTPADHREAMLWSVALAAALVATVLLSMWFTAGGQ